MLKTVDEYVAHGMLLGLVYLDQSHSYAEEVPTDVGAGLTHMRIDPDTMTTMHLSFNELSARMNQVTCGLLGPKAHAELTSGA